MSRSPIQFSFDGILYEVDHAVVDNFSAIRLPDGRYLFYFGGVMETSPPQLDGLMVVTEVELNGRKAFDAVIVKR